MNRRDAFRAAAAFALGAPIAAEAVVNREPVIGRWRNWSAAYTKQPAVWLDKETGELLCAGTTANGSGVFNLRTGEGA